MYFMNKLTCYSENRMTPLLREKESESYFEAGHLISCSMIDDIHFNKVFKSNFTEGKIIPK